MTQGHAAKEKFLRTQRQIDSNFKITDFYHTSKSHNASTMEKSTTPLLGKRSFAACRPRNKASTSQAVPITPESTRGSDSDDSEGSDIPVINRWRKRCLERYNYDQTGEEYAHSARESQQGTRHVSADDKTTENHHADSLNNSYPKSRILILKAPRQALAEMGTCLLVAYSLCLSNGKVEFKSNGIGHEQFALLVGAGLQVFGSEQQKTQKENQQLRVELEASRAELKNIHEALEATHEEKQIMKMHLQSAKSISLQQQADNEKLESERKKEIESHAEMKRAANAVVGQLKPLTKQNFGQFGQLLNDLKKAAE